MRYPFSVEQYKNRGSLPTIGHNRPMGLVALQAECLLYCGGCGHSGRVRYDDLGLADDTVFLEIPWLVRLVCSRCGIRSFEISPDWTDFAAYGNGRRRLI